MASKAQFTWIEFYIAFADALRPYAGARDRLIGKIKAVYQAIGMPLPTLEREGKVVDIDPFTVFGLFNKRLIDANRIAILRGFAREFGVKAAVPQTFDGIPVLNNQSATYYRFGNERGEHNIDNLWGVFNAALDYARTHSRESRDEFIKYYNAAIAQKGVKWNLSMGLYWIRPYEFLNLDSRNRWYIANPENMPADFVEKWGKLLDSVLSAEDYLAIIADSKDALAGSSYVYRDFPALSYYAWKVSEQVNQEERDSRTQRGNTGAAVADSGVDTLHYWIYAPGDNASMWDEFYREGIIAIGWGQIGDLRAFASKDAMKQMMRERIDASLSYKNAAHATWQFANEMKPGDIVFVKKGIRSIIGRGVVTSDYEFDAARSDDFKNVRRVNWTHHGEWAHPGPDRRR